MNVYFAEKECYLGDKFTQIVTLGSESSVLWSEILFYGDARAEP